ncbi:hypothetical protein NDU88_003080 [Pleurodeles waltl]|uniref:Uncharacterized protein n=1 Tax=Pleurodeles waltl TaxID=8319 RepID=A0AAV7WRR7_PLEWA|nr:hypothetical protein NDU88_003080 [Pleurodeles waltl]
MISVLRVQQRRKKGSTTHSPTTQQDGWALCQASPLGVSLHVTRRSARESPHGKGGTPRGCQAAPGARQRHHRWSLPEDQEGPHKSLNPYASRTGPGHARYLATREGRPTCTPAIRHQISTSACQESLA